MPPPRPVEDSPCAVPVSKHDSNEKERRVRPAADRRESTGTSDPEQIVHRNGKPVRRRISRACDQCNSLRTKCDGRLPCSHCVESSLTCEYARERKKRGKASKKDLAAQQAALATAEHETHRESDASSGDEPNLSKPKSPQGVKRKRTSPEPHAPAFPLPRVKSTNDRPMQQTSSHGASSHHPGFGYAGGSVTNYPLGGQIAASSDQRLAGPALPPPQASSAVGRHRDMLGSLGDYGSIDEYHRNILHPNATATGPSILHSGPTAMPNSMIQGGTITGYGESAHAISSPNSQTGMSGQPYRMAGSPLSAGFFGPPSMPSVAGSPAWLPLPSPTNTGYPMQHMPPSPNLRYPVLQPVIPHIATIIPINLACDLLDLYFSSTSSTFMQPRSPYLLGYVFRKRSFLRTNRPRRCSPALLASMLWVAAQTSESAYLTSPPSARGKVCQKLLELTVGLLKPLIHTPSDQMQQYGGGAVIDGVALGGLGVALPSNTHDLESGTPGASGCLDDVATYIHLATVISASEYKAASLRWWNAAWSLARELKLGRELPPNTPSHLSDALDTRTDAAGGNGTLHSGHQSQSSSEEEREERRRIWWLLFSVDRHLALCYNRPLSLLDVECESLLQPDDDNAWQAGEHYHRDASDTSFHRRGPSFEYTGHHGIFGFFLPLMTILGEIVDLNHARNHPRFGQRFRRAVEWDEQALEITHQLEAYARSLQHHTATPASSTPSTISTPSTAPHLTSEAQHQTRTQAAYSTHLMHTLHILLNGKWDPLALLDDADLWISSQSFVAATAHAVAAAEALNDILDHDPDLSFMPFFFGIYLLQGSFLLLLIADKLQADASPSVVRACETIVRAHEACVVTLNTEYQRNFRKVMRSALAQVRGRGTEDFGEQQLRRREVLALYRWTGDGTGLAL